MENIYQRIWDADQEENGIPAITPEGEKDPNRGYVVVDEQGTTDQSHAIFPEVNIPEQKRQTYDLCKKLFNNYTLDQTKPEMNTPEEDAEVHTLLETIIETKPMQLAREFVEQQSGEPMPVMRWYQKLVDICFRQYDQGENQDLSGFEHVIVGEQKGGKIGGYHFWYKYHLDDSAGFLGKDDIAYIGTRYDGPKGREGSLASQGRLVPEVVTLAYRWQAYDYQAMQRRSLNKKIGGFWVGCSIEGLMALGAVRFISQARAPKEAEINGSNYALKLFRSQDNKSVRTFYPVFLGLSQPPEQESTEPTIEPKPEPTPVSTEQSIRIVAALVNPDGDDPDKETVTLLNRTPAPVNLSGWVLADKNGKELILEDLSIPAGETAVVKLPANTVQLSNKGGMILLHNQQRQRIDSVSYTKLDVTQQGWTVVFWLTSREVQSYILVSGTTYLGTLVFKAFSKRLLN